VRTIVLDSPEGQMLLAELQREPPVLFLGSAISAFAPSSLPAGWVFADALFAFLFSADAFGPSAERSICRRLFERVPFEHVMEACPRVEIAERIVRDALTCDVANALHRCACDAIVSGRVRAIVTPNYDRCLESVPGGLAGVRRIVTCDEALGDIDREKVYYKIHGSLEPSASKYDDSVVFALRHETILPDWKREALRQIVSGRTLLVAGYSGSDFEICPELQRAGATRICWLFPNEHEIDKRNNVRRLLSVVDGTVIIGDICDLLCAISQATSKLAAKWDPRVDRLSAALVASCGEADLLEWRARLAVGMGCGSLASRAVERRASLDPSWMSTVSGARVSGNAAFHLGKYRVAFRRYQQGASNPAEPIAARCGMRLEMAEALRCRGTRWRALTTILRVQREIRSRLPAGLERTRLDGAASLRIALLARGWFEVAGRCRLRRVQDRMRPWLAGHLRVAAKAALAAGDRINLHQIQMNADRIGIPFGDLVSNDSVGVPTKEGYQNLGYLIAESMAFRDAIRQQHSLAAEDLRALRRYLRQHRHMHNWPEVWKLALIIARRGPHASRPYAFRRALAAFVRCQYAPLFRINPILWRS
jgi:hypothetical protein